jgi:ElaB/YqjD/DUF883 family membrane-anchored ribosome-binding protein
MKTESTSEPETLRSDIDMTRQRMDETIDSLGERLRPRHLLDEMLGWLRGKTEENEGGIAQVGETIARGANQALRSVVQTVKANPVPTLVIGAGVAWMIYASRQRSDTSLDDEQTESPAGEPPGRYDHPMEYPAGYRRREEEGSSTASAQLEHLKERASEITGNLKAKAAAAGQQSHETLTHLKDAAEEKSRVVREKAVEIGKDVKQKAEAAYDRTRERVANAVEQHPWEVGLACLAAGLLVGLALPTPERVNRVAGPTAERLRHRAREAGAEVLDKGKRVARAAAQAAKQEAQQQGLTSDQGHGANGPATPPGAPPSSEMDGAATEGTDATQARPAGQ